jgi:hypothetical protein
MVSFSAPSTYRTVARPSKWIGPLLAAMCRQQLGRGCSTTLSLWISRFLAVGDLGCARCPGQKVLVTDCPNRPTDLSKIITFICFAGNPSTIPLTDRQGFSIYGWSFSPYSGNPRLFKRSWPLSLAKIHGSIHRSKPSYGCLSSYADRFLASVPIVANFHTCFSSQIFSQYVFRDFYCPLFKLSRHRN